MNTLLSRAGHGLTAPFLWLHRHLLPQDEWVGWTPYLWLAYLTFFFFIWWNPSISAYGWAMTWLAALVFLVLYFRFYWFNDGAPERFRVIASITLLGLIFIPYLGNGQVLIIYAAAFAGFSGSMKKGLVVLAIIMGAMVLEAILFRLTPWVWFSGLFFGSMIGLGNIYFAEMGRKNRVIRQSQDEIRKLAATAERERIARDLHDLLGHTLTLITVKAELAAKLAERDLADAAREIREVEMISRNALQQVREAVGGYRSGGLAGEMVNARIALDAANIALKECQLSAPLPAEHNALLSMVLREAITNVVRHSGAHECRIHLEINTTAAKLCVEDDGRGGRFEEGNGIRGMRERLHALDGDIEIRSNLAGTTLCASLPLLPHDDTTENSRAVA